MNNGEFMADELIAMTEARHKLQVENERLKSLLRDECMGHADGCGCPACREVFRVDTAGEQG